MALSTVRNYIFMMFPIRFVRNIYADIGEENYIVIHTTIHILL